MTTFDWVPNHQVSPHRLRVVDGQVHREQAARVATLLNQGQELTDSEVLAQMGSIIDPLIQEIESRATAGTWPWMPREVISNGAFVGTSAAIIERKAGLYQVNVTHPAVHVLLWVMAQSIDEEVPAPICQLPIEAAFLAARAGLPVSAVMAPA